MGTYADWEANEGEALNQVAVFCRHLLRGNTSFTNDSQPPISEVEIYLANNYSTMVVQMSQFGVSAAQTDADIKRFLQKYLVACTVVDVENTAPVTGSGRAPNPRVTSFREMCKGFYEMLSKGVLQSMPDVVLFDHNLYPEWTGTSKARKETLAANTDLVQPDITREMMEDTTVDDDF